jgi:iron complex outermembrane receptor protein
MSIERGILSRALRSVTASGIGLLAVSSIHAQSTTGAPVEEVVVTGFRESLNNALEIKKAEAGVVDAILAEDIADFPDSNLAESLQRVPGVALARGDGGEGKQISVRGLGPGFTRVRLNGMEAQATTGGSDITGGANRGRGFDFSVFASELFNSIQVRKTSAADVEEGSLGATVDLRTSRPFDFADGVTLAGNVQGSYNDLTEHTDPRAAVLFSNTFADRTFGVLASVAYSERQVHEEGYTAVNVLRATEDGGFCSPVGVAPQNPATTPAKGTDALNCATGMPRTSTLAAYNSINSQNVFLPRLPRYVRQATDYERIGGTLSLQWAPTDRTTLSFDGLLGKFDVTRRDSFIAGLSFGRAASANGKPHTSAVEAVVDPNGTLVYGLFNGVDVRSETLLDQFQTDFTQGTLELGHAFSDSLELTALVGVAQSDFDNPIRTTINLDVVNANGYALDFRGNNEIPHISYGVDITNPNNFAFAPTLADGTVFGTVTMRDLRVKNDNTTSEVNLAWKPTDDFALRGGVQLRKAEFDSIERQRINNNITPSLPAGTTLASLTKLLTGFGSSLPGYVPDSWVIADYNAFDRALGISAGTAPFDLYGPAESAPSRGGNRGVEEEVRAAYVQGEFSSDILPIQIRGNLGVRYAETTQTSYGYQSIGAAPGYVLVTIERDYHDWLPSLNLAADLTDTFVVRLAAAKVLSRADLGALTPGGAVNNTTRDISSGNPFLNPVRAKTYDLSFEWYPQQGALVSLGLFAKDIGSFIQTIRQTVPFSATGLPESVLAGTTTTTADLFNFSRAVNTSGGDLKGVELNYQQPFTFLPGPLANTGLLFNYTYVESQIQYVGDTQKRDLVGLSPEQINATVYYEDDRLSARVSGAYRDAYLVAVPSGAPGTDVQGTRSTLYVDAALSFSITDNFKVSLEALNLTDEPTSFYMDSRRDDTLFHTVFGRTFTVGAAYRM